MTVTSRACDSPCKYACKRLNWRCIARQTVDELVAAGNKSASIQNVPQSLEYLAKVVVQDACVLIDRFPDHPVYQRLMANAEFRCACSLRLLTCLPAFCVHCLPFVWWRMISVHSLYAVGRLSWGTLHAARTV